MALNKLFKNIKNKKVNFEKYKNNIIFKTKDNDKIIKIYYHEEDDTISVLTYSSYSDSYFINFLDENKRRVFFQDGEKYISSTSKKIGNIVYFFCVYKHNYVCYMCIFYYENNEMKKININSNFTGSEKLDHKFCYLFEKNNKLMIVMQDNFFIKQFVLEKEFIREANKLVCVNQIDKFKFTAKIINGKLYLYNYSENSTEVLDIYGRQKNYNYLKQEIEIKYNYSIFEDLTVWLNERDTYDIRHNLNYIEKQKNYFYLHVPANLSFSMSLIDGVELSDDFEKNTIIFFKNWTIKKNRKYNNLKKRKKIFYLVCVFKNNNMKSRNMEKILKYL